MPDVRMPDGVVVRFPDDMPPEQIRSLILSKFPDAATQAQQTQQPLEGSLFDIPLQVAQGATYGARGLTDILGAENVLSSGLRGVEDYLGGLLSAQAKNDQAEIARIFQDAEDKGFGAQLSAAWEAIKTAPASALAQGVGTALPTLGAAYLTRGQSLAIPALIGAAQGAGIIKGSLYDSVQQQLLAAGATEEQAAKAASQAQSYTGDNLDMILTGGFIGALTGGTGIEPIIAGRVAGNVAKSLIGRTLIGATAEAVPEAIQGGQEQLAQNLALQRAGFDVPTTRGVVSSAAYEALVGAGLGAGIGAAEPLLARGERPETARTTPPPPSVEAFTNEPAAVQEAAARYVNLGLSSTEALRYARRDLGISAATAPAPEVTEVTGVTEAPEVTEVTGAPEVTEVTGVPEVTGVTGATEAPRVTPTRTYYPEETEFERQERMYAEEQQKKEFADLGAPIDLTKTIPSAAPEVTPAPRLTPPTEPVKAPPSIESELRSYIKKLGGIKITDNEGQVTSEGSNVLAAIKDTKDKKLVNNKTGVTPDYLREQLAGAGWFGPRADAQAEIGNFYDLLAKSTQEGPVYHPESKKAQKQTEAGYKGPTVAEVDAELNAVLRTMPNEPKFKRGERELGRSLYAQYGGDAESAVADIIERRAKQAETGEVKAPVKVAPVETPAELPVKTPAELGVEDARRGFVGGPPDIFTDEQKTEWQEAYDTERATTVAPTPAAPTPAAPTPAAPTPAAPTRTADNVVADAKAALKKGQIKAKDLTNIKTLAAQKKPVADLDVALETALDESAGGAIRTRRAPGATGRILADVKRVVDTLTAGWKSDLEVVVVQNVAQLPDNIKAKVERAGDGVRGVAVTDGNTAYLIADNLGDDSDIAATLYHEALGHAGLTRLFGEKLDSVLRAIYSTNPDLKREADAWSQNNPDEYAGEANRELRALEEVLAERAERGEIKPAVMSRLAALFRDFGRRLGMKLAYTDKDVSALMYRASRRVTAGSRRAPTPETSPEETRFARVYKNTSPEEDPEAVADAIGAAVEDHSIDKFAAALKPSIAVFGPKKLKALLQGTPVGTIVDDWFSEALPQLKTAVGFAEQRNAAKNNILRNFQPLRVAIDRHVAKYGPDALAVVGEQARIYSVNLTENPTRADGLANDLVLTYLRKRKKPNVQKITEREAEINSVYDAVDTLKKQGKGFELYLELKKFYRSMYDLERNAFLDYLDSLKGVIPDADLAAIRDKSLEAEAEAERPDSDYYEGAPKPKLIENYVPFMRFGEFTLVIPPKSVAEFPDGYREHFTTEQQRNARVNEFAAKYKRDPKDSTVFKLGFNAKDALTPLVSDNKALTDLYSIIDNAKVEDAAVSFLRSGTANRTSEEVVNDLRKELKERLNNVVLSRLPQRSIGKRKMKARNIPGMSRDVSRVFDVSLNQYANQIPKMLYAPKARLALSAARDMVTPDVPNDVAEKLNIVIDDVAQRIESAFNPPAKNRFVTAIKEFTYLMLLSSPATAMVQTSSIPIRALPNLASKYGMKNASAVLARNSKIFAQVGTVRTGVLGTKQYTFKELDSLAAIKNNPTLLRAFYDLRNRGAFYETLRAAISGPEGRPVRAAWSKAYDIFYNVGSALFNTSEALTRQIIAMSAFELEYKKTGDYEAALASAVKAAKDIVGDYSEIGRLPVLSGPVGEFIFQFKQYAVITTRFFWTNFYKALPYISGVSREEKIRALNELTGVLAMGGLFHGLVGMPLFTLITSTIDVLRNAFEDDDDFAARSVIDPYSAGSSALWFRNHWLPNTFGDVAIPGIDGKQHSLADILERGLFSELTDANVGSRTTFDQLWFRSPRTAETWQDWFKNLVFANLGPSVSLGESAASALDDFNEGNLLRGLGKILPAFGRGPAAAYRLATEGERVGEDIAVAPREISDANIIAQVLNLRPTDVVERLEKVYAVKGGQIRIQRERTGVLRGLNRALTGASGAPSLRDAVQDMTRFNRRYLQPDLQITPDTINDSLNTYINNRENSVRGVAVTPDNYLYVLNALR